MNTDHTKYTIEQLLVDDYFIETTFAPSPSSDKFWNTQIQQGNLEAEVYVQAKQILLSSDISVEHKDELFGKVKSTIRRKRIVRIAKYASAAIVLLTLSFFYLQLKRENSFVETSSAIAQQLKDTSDIVLLTDNANSTLIEGRKATLDFSNDESVIVNSKKKLNFSAEKVEMHQVIVPYGKQIFLILPDKTKLWVNAGTTVKFPSAFVGDRREIYVNGEVYGDVTPNREKPFIFKTKKFDVQVLGTSLNVNAYESFSRSRVTLVEGKVKVKASQGDFFLDPNQSFVQNQSSESKMAVDVKYYTSWKDGYYHFKNEKLSNVLEDLSRFYGKKISCDSELQNKLCSGNLSLNQDLSSVLDGIAFTLKVHIKRENNTYIFESKPM